MNTEELLRVEAAVESKAYLQEADLRGAKCLVKLMGDEA